MVGGLGRQHLADFCSTIDLLKDQIKIHDIRGTILVDIQGKIGRGPSLRLQLLDARKQHVDIENIYISVPVAIA